MTTEPIAGEVVWLQPEKVALAVEIVYRGSERTDEVPDPS